MLDNIDLIINAYKDIHIKAQDSIRFNNFTITNPNSGIGDALSVYLLDKPIYNKNINVIIRHPSIINELNQFNSFISSTNNRHNPYHSLFSVWDIQSYSTFGGHLFQKIQQFLGLDIDIKPRAKLNSNIATIPNKVVMTFDKGAVNQQHIHPRARIIYEESKEIIQKFIDDNHNKYNFIEVGRFSLGLNNVINKTNLGIQKTAEEIASCDYFFGNHNGLMHIAAAFNKKSIIIVNFPDANKIILPCLKKRDIPDIDWLYPQNVHLHQDNDGPLVKKLSYENIENAFNHQLYPYFTDQFLLKTFSELINE